MMTKSLKVGRLPYVVINTPRFGETMNLNACFLLSHLSITLSRPIMVFADTHPQLLLIHFGETMNLNYSSAFSCSSFSPCSSVLPDYHLHLSHQIVFFVGATPPLSLNLSAGHKQLFGVEFHPFCHFSVTFIHPELRYFQTHSQFFLIRPGLFLQTNGHPCFSPDVHSGHQTGPRKAKNWLSPEAVNAKKQRRRLEPRWKASNAEPDLLAYLAAHSSANKLITTTFAASNLERINEASKTPNVFGQLSNPYYIHLLLMNNSHLPYHNHWRILWLLSFTRRLFPLKI